MGDAEDIYSWWIKLLIEHNLSFEKTDPSKSEAIIAIEKEDDAVHLKYEPREYFFGVDFGNGGPILYTFLPEQGFVLRPENRKSFCGKLEHELNSSFSDKKSKKRFERYFQLPLKTGFETRKFGERKYSGVIVLVPARPESFYGKKGVKPVALEQWRTKVFGKLNKFFRNNVSRR